MRAVRLLGGDPGRENGSEVRVQVVFALWRDGYAVKALPPSKRTEIQISRLHVNAGMWQVLSNSSFRRRKLNVLSKTANQTTHIAELRAH